MVGDCDNNSHNNNQATHQYTNTKDRKTHQPMQEDHQIIQWSKEPGGNKPRKRTTEINTNRNDNYTSMGFVTDMKGRKREKHTRQPPYAQIQEAFLVFSCSDPMQDKPNMPGWSMDHQWIEWAQRALAHIRSIG